MRGIIGRKIGMTRIFDESGMSHAATVIEAGPCYVTQVKTHDTDGYDAVQLGFGDKKEKRATKAEKGHVAKAGLKPFTVLKEFRDFESSEELGLGDEVKADLFKEGERVKVTGVSKGRGFAGVMKRHNFSGAQTTHGQSDRWRAPGSIGQASWPSKVMKGLKMAGRMGGKNRTVRNLAILKIDTESNMIIVKGAIPGANKGIVLIRK